MRSWPVSTWPYSPASEMPSCWACWSRRRKHHNCLDQEGRDSMTITLQQRIRAALAKPLRDDRSIDPLRELEDVLQGVGLNREPAGGSIRFTGKAPIISSPLPLGTLAGAGPIAKAVAAAGLRRPLT